MVFTCQFHQPSVSYLLPQCCFALTMGTSISINFPKGQLRSRFGNKSRKVQCRKYHWILNNFLVSATRSFPWFQFALVYRGQPHFSLQRYFWSVLLCLEDRLPAFPWAQQEGKRFLPPSVQDINICGCFSSPGFVKMGMFTSFRGNIHLYPKGVNWPLCLN